MKKLSLLLLTLFTLSVAKAQSIEAVDGPYIMFEGKGTGPVAEHMVNRILERY